MASLYSTTSTSTSSASTIRGYGGLVSGLDRDSLITAMTSGTQTKIDIQSQKLQKTQWQMDAYRTISSSLVSFSSKYLSYTSSTNLSASSYFAQNAITASGDNASCVSASGTLNGSSSFSIVGIKQLASTASATTTTSVSDQILKSGSVSTDISTQSTINNLEGESFYLTYGSTSYTVKLQTGTSSDGFTYDYSTMENAAASINKSLEQVSLTNGDTLADVLSVTQDGSKFTFTSNDTAGNTLKFTGGSNSILQNLGILSSSETVNTADSAKLVISTSGLTASNNATLTTQASFIDRVAGKSMTFSYNGTTAKITLPTADKLSSLQDIVDSLQSGLDSAYGTGRTKVSLVSDGSDSAYFSFATTTPGGEADTSSVLSVSYADTGLLGATGAFKMVAGESNRLNTSASMSTAGLSRYASAGVSESDTLDLTINGVAISGLTYGSTISEIITAINNSTAAKVSISYLSNSDRLVLNSTESGASGSVSLSGKAADILFGESGTDYSTTSGQDAIATVKYSGSDETMDIVRGTNQFTLDGLTLSLKKEFGYTETDNGDGSTTYTAIADTDPIEFSGSANTDTIVSTVKQMITDYNAMLDAINTELTTKSDSDYQPLTDAQKEEMTDDQIEKWDTKAKAGSLFNDDLLRGLSDSLQSLIGAGTVGKTALSKIGITISTDYADKGKLVLDESALTSALQSDPQSVKNAFTRAADTSTGDQGGLMIKMKTILDKYAKTTGATKGSLIARAGSTSAPTSIISNTLQKEIDSINDYIDSLKDQKETETDRYITQFTNLETAISTMNSQSSWLSSATSSS